MDGDWEVSKTTGKCAASDRELAEGESYYAVLLEGPAGLERRDYSLAAWNGPPPGSFCYWRARVPVREKRHSPVAVNFDLLTHLFLSLADEESETKQNLRFVLALLLLRKRLLKIENTVQDDQREYWEMRLVNEDSVHRVANPRLNGEEINRLSAQLVSILSGEVETFESLEQGEARHPGEGAESEGGIEMS